MVIMCRPFWAVTYSIGGEIEVFLGNVEKCFFFRLIGKKLDELG